MVRTSEEAGDGLNVKIYVLGSPVQELYLANGSTVGDALESAGLDMGSTVRAGGEVVNLSDKLEDNDELRVTANVKGGC